MIVHNKRLLLYIQGGDRVGSSLFISLYNLRRSSDSKRERFVVGMYSILRLDFGIYAQFTKYRYCYRY